MDVEPAGGRTPPSARRFFFSGPHSTNSIARTTPTVSGIAPSCASYSILIRRGLCGPQVKSIAAIRTRILMQSICFSVPSATATLSRRLAAAVVSGGSE